jgi:hypothetical protein
MQKKASTKFNILSRQKALRKVGIEEMHLNIIKAKYDNPTATVTLNGDKLKPFTQNQEQDKGVYSPHSHSV